MFILNFIPNSFFIIIAIITIILFFITRFLPEIIPYSKILHYFLIPIFLLTLFLMGANWNNDHWLEKLRAETAKVEQAIKDQEIANLQLDAERKEKLNSIQQAAQRERELNKKFIDVLKSKDATVQNVLVTLSRAEQDKYAALSSKDKAAADKKLQDLLDNAKNCPTVPELYIERLNNTAKGLK